MTTVSVTPSGSIGKQVYATTKPVTLKGFLLSHLSANAHVVIRDGNASGTIMAQHGSLSAQNAEPVLLPEGGQRYDKGMHVKVLGTNAVCYLFVD